MPGVVMTASCKQFFELLCDGNGSEFRFMEAPTYIHAFFEGGRSERQDITLVYGVDKSAESDSSPKVLQSPDSDSALEYTGNPLECPFGDDDYEPTVSSIYNCWRKEEEGHHPISLQEARAVLSAFNLRHSDEESGSNPRPVWVVCSDPLTQTVLLSSHVHDGWCTASRVRYLEPMSKQQICQRLASVQLQHLSITGTPQQELLSEVLCTYNIHGDLGIAKHSVILEVKWTNAATLSVPLYDAEAIVSLKVTVGEEDSILYALWRQLNAVNYFMEQLKVLQLQRTDVPDNLGEVNVVFRDLIVTVLREASYHLGVRYGPARSREDREGEKKVVDLEKIARTVAGGGRNNNDLMDLLWILMCECENSEELARSINTVLRIIKHDGRKYNIHQSYRNMRLAQETTKLLEEGSKCPSIQREEACEMIVEVALEKLMRDYWFILLEAELLTADQLQHATHVLTSRASPGEAVNSKLALLGRLHCVTELLLLAHTHFNATPAVLRHLGAEACRSLLQAHTTFQELVQQREVVLTSAVAIPHVQGHISNQSFSRYRLRLTSRLPLHEVHTIFLCSLEQIFPSTIISCPDESLSSTEWNRDENTYFCYELLANKNKLV